MKFQFYHEKLINSKEYQKFFKEHKDAFPCSGFFVIDKDKGHDRFCIDFYLPSEKKIYSFRLDGTVEFVPVDNYDKRVPEKIGLNYDFDLKDYEKMIVKKLEDEKIKGKVQKFLFSLQKLDKKDFLVVTVLLSNLALVKLHLDIAENKIVQFERKSFMSMLKVFKGKGKKDL